MSILLSSCAGLLAGSLAVIALILFCGSDPNVQYRFLADEVR